MDVANELKKEGISVEVVDLRTLRPLDQETLLQSVAKTHRALIIQEQHSVASYGAYLSHLINHEIFDQLDAPVELVSSLEAGMPYARSIESIILPSKERAIAAAKTVLQGFL